MTLIEVVVAMTVFTLGSVGIIECYNLYNASAARNRCAAVAQATLQTRVNKVLSDPWTGTNAIPADCVVSSGYVPSVDSTDIWGGGKDMVLMSTSTSPTGGPVTGTITRYTRALDNVTRSVVIDYTLTYTIRGTAYTVTASVVRAADY